MCIGHLEKNKMENKKEFRITVTVQPDLTIDIKGQNPCDVLAVSGAAVQQLRLMGLEPRAEVKS
jgi:hypothetical protein